MKSGCPHPAALGPLDLYAWFALVAAAVAVATGAYVVLVRPRDRVNRSLGGFFIVGGLIMGASRVVWIVPWENVAHALAVLDTVLGIPIAAAYMLLIGVAIRSPLAAPFRHPRVRIAILVATCALALALVAFPDLYVVDFRPSEEWRWDWTGTWISHTLFYVGPLAALYALAAAIDAHRRAPARSAERARTLLYLRTFGILDGAGAAVIIVTPLLPWESLRLGLGYLGLPVILLLVYPAVAYAVLRKQVIEIDLRLRGVTRRGVLLAAFAVAFWLGEQIIQPLIPVQGPVWGLLSAAALTVAFRPLDRAAERLADRLFPGVSSSSQYLDERRSEVYAAAVESATNEDGVIDGRGRAILDKLRVRLGLTPEQAQQLEANVA